MAANTQALVIGNGGYPEQMKLNNPARDASAIRSTFEELGIEVIVSVDETCEKLKEKIDAFLVIVNDPKVTVSILFYSGHGLQIDNVNYIVPVDFKDPGDPALSRLLSVQSIIDRMINATAVKIVLLDACRTGADLKQVVAGTRSLEIDRTIRINGTTVATQGLAEIKGSSDTFIAFAAGPGEVARDGIAGGELSPFTGSLVRHLTSVDLPLSNLTGRVREEVLNETLQLQRTWDQSSLRSPFYFNPGSLLLFAGNLMALLGLLISMVIYSLVLTSPCINFIWVCAALLLPVVSFVVLLRGIQGVYSRLRGQVRPRKDLPAKSRLLKSLVKGATGGFLGSLACSLFVSGPYYWKWTLDGTPIESFGQLYLEITYGTALAACVLGALSLTGSLAVLIQRRMTEGALRYPLWILLGSAIGGTIAGLMVAPLITWYFGSMRDRPEMTPGLLIPGSVVGSALLVFAIVNFDLETLTTRRLWASALAAICALFAGLPIAALVFGPLYLFGVVGVVTRFLEANYDNAVGLLGGGVIYGAPVGLILGCVIACAVVLTRQWSGKPVLT